MGIARGFGTRGRGVCRCRLGRRRTRSRRIVLRSRARNDIDFNEMHIGIFGVPEILDTVEIVLRHPVTHGTSRRTQTGHTGFNRHQGNGLQPVTIGCCAKFGAQLFAYDLPGCHCVIIKCCVLVTRNPPLDCPSADCVSLTACCTVRTFPRYPDFTTTKTAKDKTILCRVDHRSDQHVGLPQNQEVYSRLLFLVLRHWSLCAACEVQTLY